MIDVSGYLQAKGFEFKTVDRPSGPQAIMNCPFCGDSEHKFAVNLNTGAYQCMHENRCGRRGSFFQLQRELGDEPERYIDRVGAKKQDYKRPKAHSKKDTARAREYLQTRGLNDETIKAFRIGQSGDSAVMFPYFKGGELVNVKYRTIREKKMWQESGAEPSLFNRDRIGPKLTELVITEGEIDAMTWDQYGLPAVSVPSGVRDTRWVEVEWEWLERFDTVYLSFDMDSAGEEAVKEVARRLGLWRCYRVELPYKDANECLVAGLSKDEMMNCLLAAQGYSIPDLVNPSSQTEDVIELYENPEKRNGFPTLFEKLQNTMKGWRPSELTIWTGQNGSGKTTVLNQIMLAHAFANNQRVFIASMEMPVTRLLYWMTLAHTKVYSREAVKQFIESLDGSIVLLNRDDVIDEDTLINVMEFAARKYGIRTFVVDSLMRVGLNLTGQNELEGQKQFTGRLVNFAKAHMAHVHLVAHPRKSASDDAIPGKIDIAGTSNIANLAANVLIMWRPSTEMREKWETKMGLKFNNVLIVAKNREHGTLGWVPLVYNAGEKAFTEARASKNKDAENGE